MTIAPLQALRLLSPRRKLLIAIVTVFSASTAHYAGFLMRIPPGMERLVATSFAVEFTALFLYYAATSAVLARGVHYLTLVIIALGPYMWYRFRAAITKRYARKYLRRSKSDLAFHDGASWFIWAFTFASLYVELSNISPFFYALLVILPVILLLRFPHFSLAPRLFMARMRSPNRKAFQLGHGSEILYVLAGLIVVFSYALGEARFKYLANAPVTKYVDSRYSSEVVVLIRANNMTLALERLQDKKRFLLFHNDFLAAETIPKEAGGFPSLPTPTE